jgi:tetratricopeptide (TPR) repeat protein
MPRSNALLAIAGFAMAAWLCSATAAGQSLADLARAEALADRNEQAAALFAQAVEEQPELRGELLLDWAEQLTYARRPEEAVPLFEEFLDSGRGSDAEARARLGLGLALAWSGRLEEAIAVYEYVLLEDSENVIALQRRREAEQWQVGRLVELAREAARAERSREAIELYERALAQGPELRPQLLREFADQLTIAEQPGRAIPLFREALAVQDGGPDEERRARLGLALALVWNGRYREAMEEYERLLAVDPDDMEARKGRARVLAWTDRLEPAAREYRKVLKEDPTDREARRELARVESWRGRQQRAQRELREMLREDPTDVDARLALADAQRWMGRPDRAMIHVERALERRPDRREALELKSEILRDARPSSDFQFNRSRLADGLRLDQFSTSHEWTFESGRSALGAQYSVFEYNENSRAAGRVERPGIFGRRRFSDGVELGGAIARDEVSTFRQNGAPSPLIFDLFATTWPSDWWRLELGFSRTTFDTLQALEEGVTAESLSLAADWTPNERWRGSVRASSAWFDDGNQRWWGQFELERRLRSGQPSVFLGLRYTAYDFDELLRGDFFNVGSLQAWLIALRAHSSLGRSFTFDVESAIGFEDTSPGGSRATGSLRTRLIWQATERLEIEARGEVLGLRETLRDGLSRRSVGLGARYAW